MLTTDKEFFIKYTEDKNEQDFIEYAGKLGEGLEQCELFFDHTTDTVRTILKTPNHGNFLRETPIR